MPKISYDICVVGGGPAGAIAALQLARFHFKVLLVEKQDAARKDHIGLSLTPGIHHWLEELNIAEPILSEGFQLARTSKVLWRSDTPEIKEFSSENAGFHVHRGRFDALLLEMCQAEGVTVVQPGILTDVKNKGDEGWNFLLHNQKDNSVHSVHVPFLVDAAGRNGFLKSKKHLDAPKLLAIHAKLDRLPTGDSFSFIEAADDHWNWAALNQERRGIFCTFVSPEKLKSSPSINDLYRECFESSQLASDLFFAPDPALFIETCDATAQHDAHVIDVNYIKIGDAAVAIDPISSQGVQKAIKSAVQGAILVNSMLNHGTVSQAIRFYEQRVRSDVENNQRWTANFYREQGRFTTDFWKVRSAHSTVNAKHTSIQISANDRLSMNPKGHFALTPVLGKDRLDEMEAFILPSELEPIIYVESTYLPPLLKQMDGHSLKQGLQLLAGTISSKSAIEVMEWLIWKEILVAKL